MYSSALLAIIERAGHDTAVLVDGLSEAEFLRSRVTRAEVRRLIRNIADTAANTPPELRTQLAQIDWDGWIAIGARLRQTCQRSRPWNTASESSTASSAMRSKAGASSASSAAGSIANGGPFGSLPRKK